MSQLHATVWSLNEGIPAYRGPATCQTRLLPHRLIYIARYKPSKTLAEITKEHLTRAGPLHLQPNYFIIMDSDWKSRGLLYVHLHPSQPDPASSSLPSISTFHHPSTSLKAGDLLPWIHSDFMTWEEASQEPPSYLPKSSDNNHLLENYDTTKDPYFLSATDLQERHDRNHGIKMQEFIDDEVCRISQMDLRPRQQQGEIEGEEGMLGVRKCVNESCGGGEEARSGFDDDSDVTSICSDGMLGLEWG